MLHICDLNNFYAPTGGGVFTYHHNKLAYFRQRGDIQYTLFEPSDHEAMHVEGCIRRVKFPGIPGNPPYRYMVNAYRLRRVLNELKPDLIEIGSGYILPWMVKFATAFNDSLRPVVTGFWHADYPTTYVRRWLSPISPRLAERVERMAWWYVRQTYGRYDATFAAANCVVEKLWQRGVPRVFQTPLGVDLEQFHPGQRDLGLRREVGATGDRPLLFFPHRLQEEKGLSTLLDAFPAIYQAQRPVLVFAGEGPRKAKLDAFIAQHPDVHYIGFIREPKEIARWFASADAIFALSPFETFGLAAAEAMASGTALIAADQGAVPELVTTAECGVLVPYNDAAALSERTIDLLKSRRLRQVGQNGRRFAIQFFSWTAVFDRIVAFYEELVATASIASLDPHPRLWCPTQESG